jgi:anti-anti-sigma factor
MLSEITTSVLDVDSSLDRVLVRLGQQAINADQAEAPRNQLAELVEDLNCPMFELDLGDVEYLTATGLGTLVALHTQLRDAGRQLVLLSARLEVEHILHVTRLDTFLELHRELVPAGRRERGRRTRPGGHI